MLCIPKLDVKTTNIKIVDATTAHSMKVDAKKADAKKADAKMANAKKDGSKRAQALKADLKSTDDKAKEEARVSAKKNTKATDDHDDDDLELGPIPCVWFSIDISASHTKLFSTRMPW